jgi:hypothetical protein
MYFTVIKLKRVEADTDHIYVSDYFKTYRYLKTDTESIDTRNYYIFKVTTLTMKDKTKMGRKIKYIGDWTTQMV